MTTEPEKHQETEGRLEQLKDLLFEIQLLEGNIKTTKEINARFPGVCDAFFMKKVRKYEGDIERLKNEYNCLLNTLEPFRDEEEQAEVDKEKKEADNFFVWLNGTASWRTS